MTTSAEQAAHVVDGFARVWAHPRVDDFLELFTSDVRLTAPLVEPSVGPDQAYEEFARLLYVWPDAHGVINRWSATDDVVFIEWTLQGDFYGRHLAFRLVDRIVFRDGLIAEREMFADGLTIASAFLKSPRGWWRVWRSGMAPGHRSRWLLRAFGSSKRFRRPSPSTTEGA